VGVGSRDEDPGARGATHYLEHLLFKGTRRRTALEISAEMDAGRRREMNGVHREGVHVLLRTGARRGTCRVAVDVLSDMVTSSLNHAEGTWDAERNCGARRDRDERGRTPRNTVHEAFTAKLFGDTPLGRPILGTTDSIQRDHTGTRSSEHYEARYTPEHLGVAAAGQPGRTTRWWKLVKQAFGPVLEPGSRAPARPPG